jgi:hypothetical protein
MSNTTGETVLAFVLPKTCSNTAGDRHGRTCPLELINKSLKSLGRGTGTLPSRWATIKTVRYLTQNNDNGTLRLVDAEKHSLDKLDLAYNALTGCAPTTAAALACTGGCCKRAWLQS